MDRIRVRADFLRAARGIRRSAGALTLEVTPTPEERAETGMARIGVTASRKVGNAVARNRAKRRLRAAAAAVLPLYGREGNDYVLVARRDTLTRGFDSLLEDLTGALKSAHAKLGLKQVSKQGPSEPGEAP